MIENLLLRIRSGTVQVLEEAVESWQREHSNGKYVRDVTDAVRVCASWPQEMHALVDSLWRRIAVNQIVTFQKTGEAVLNLYDRMLNTLEFLRALTALYEREGHPITGADELAKIQADLQRLRQQFQDSWPWLTEEMIREAREEIARGEYQTIQEILDELQRARS